MDIFDIKKIQPMLIGASADTPFEDTDYVYELKFDGERAIAYLSSDGTELRNKRNKKMQSVFPELKEIHRQVKSKCILDGEYIVIKNGKPNFSEVQKRSLMNNPFKISCAAERNPVSFIAFDILYFEDKDITSLPLIDRKELLKNTVIDGERLACSKVFETGGIPLFDLAKTKDLEGIVAKKRNSSYFYGKRTKDWIKIKNLLDDDFVVCGWIDKSGNVNSIVLGQYIKGELTYKGHVTLGITDTDLFKIKSYLQSECPFKNVPKGNEDANWVKPILVCIVKFMERTQSGGMRQPIFKGLRYDKIAKECEGKS